MKRIITTTGLAIAIALPGAAALAQKKMDDMKGMDMGKKPAAGAQAVHKTKAIVKKVDAKAGRVTLAHEPVASLNWPSMTMGFKVKESALLNKLTEGKRVEVEFVQEGKDYVIQSVQ
ncbi:copper-binding protein [Acidovorax sp. LjRoot118]|uniref:copper-binding protein n=1 Tax=Acidovorax sp. LjRoot118 TaxID=3342256 RepID=UPI003ECC2283